MKAPSSRIRGAIVVISIFLFFALDSLVGRKYVRFQTKYNQFVKEVSLPIKMAASGTDNDTNLNHHGQRLTLPEITKSYENYTCPEGLVYVHDTVLPDYDSLGDRKIPRVIHMTSKSRCLTPAFANNVEKWRFPGHSFFFHDDDAVDRFIRQEFALFPHFRNVMKCITSAAAKADLWRYLMIWEHGGIYTDFDNTPERGFQQGNAIHPTDDAWFPLEALGVVAQFFFAASPNHPIMYTSLHWGLRAIWSLDSISNNKAPYTTGPRATKNGFIDFMAVVGVQTNGYIPSGIYVGMDNRSVTVVGNKTRPHEFVNRGGVRNKLGEYAQMGMMHFSKQRSGQRVSCSHHIYLEYVKEMIQTSIEPPVEGNASDTIA